MWKWPATRGLPERAQPAAMVSCRHPECKPMATDMDMKTAIRKGDTDAVRLLLAEDVSRANALIRWRKNRCVHTHPLHFVSDMLFEGTLAKGKELPLIDALIEAGADLDFQRDREDGKKSDTPLIGAASLGAEEVGLRLLDAGARPELRGLFGETALHWAAFLGESRLTERLIEGSDINLKDEISFVATRMGDSRMLQPARRESRKATPGGGPAREGGCSRRRPMAGISSGARR